LTIEHASNGTAKRVEDCMYDWLWQIQWIEVRAFLTSGQPSLLFQLAIINAVLMIAIIFIRLRRDTTTKKRSNYFILEALLFLNIFILSEDYFSPFYYQYIEPLIYNFKHQVL
jgi:hypothetical protein